MPGVSTTNMEDCKHLVLPWLMSSDASCLQVQQTLFVRAAQNASGLRSKISSHSLQGFCELPHSKEISCVD